MLLHVNGFYLMASGDIACEEHVCEFNATGISLPCRYADCNRERQLSHTQLVNVDPNIDN